MLDNMYSVLSLKIVDIAPPYADDDDVDAPQTVDADAEKRVELFAVAIALLASRTCVVSLHAVTTVPPPADDDASPPTHDAAVA